MLRYEHAPIRKLVHGIVKLHAHHTLRVKRLAAAGRALRAEAHYLVPTQSGDVAGERRCFLSARPRMCSDEAPLLVPWYPYTCAKVSALALAPRQRGSKAPHTSAVSNRFTPLLTAASKIFCSAGCTSQVSRRAQDLHKSEG